MSVISRLPEQVINQIAAGEVVERPASVVKELVENSIDAGATSIKIFIEQGGKALIRVVDNGSGILKDDLANATKRHWTSKISSVEDLHKIESMGFRGEALASIASVSKFSMRSRTSENDHGWELTGGTNELKPVGMPVGTEVIVKDLFYNVPARRNFLKSDRTEGARITALVHQLALANPNIAFSLEKDGRSAFKTSGDGNAQSVIELVLGKGLHGRLLEVFNEHPQIKVTGFIGRPGTGTPGKPKQLVFINHRVVESDVVRAAVHKGYDSLLGRHEKPQFALFIEIAPHLVDFNVHPQKKEVRLLNSNVIFQLVHQAVVSALSSYDPFVGSSSNENYALEPLQQFEPSSEKISASQDWLASRTAPAEGKSYPRVGTSTTRGLWGNVERVDESGTDVVDTTQARGKVFQLLNLFIVEELEDAIMMYDQHALHERILYEQFSSAWLNERDKNATQALLVPEVISLSEEERLVFGEGLETLSKIGFGFDMTDEGVKIKRVPSVVSGSNLEKLIREYIKDILSADEFDISPAVSGIDLQTHRRLAYMACRSAIKSGDRLTELEIRRLLDDYKKTTVRFTCPHGRPVQVKITRLEMEKWFKR